MPHRRDGEYVIPPESDDDDEQSSAAFSRPVYPRITRSQWSVLVALTDAECSNIIAAAAFYSQLPKAARDFLKDADDDKIDALKNQMTWFSNAKVIWKFLLVGGGMLFGGFIAVTQFIKVFGDYVSVKLK